MTARESLLQALRYRWCVSWPMRLLCRDHGKSGFATRFWRTWCYGCGRRWYLWPFTNCESHE